MAVYKPDPDRGPVEDLIEDLAREITDRYKAVEDDLIREVAIRVALDARLQALADTSGNLSAIEQARVNRILADLARQRARGLRELQQIAAEKVRQLQQAGLAQKVIDLAATLGAEAAAARLGLAAPRQTITGTASQAVASIAFDLQSRLGALNQRLTRYPQDIYQRVASLYSPGTVLGVTTSRAQQARTVQKFLTRGVTGFTDRAGRDWTIGSYAEMAGRTTVNRAYNDAGVWRMQQSGINLVTVVRGLDSCRACAAWSGAILSTDGTPAGTVTLPRQTGDGTVEVTIAGTVEEARNAGWNHPNCRCRLIPYMPGLTIPQADTTYDEAAETERATQRALEREIRAAKRREVSALTDTDRAKARREVRDAQIDIREFTTATGRRRDSYREQLHFSDGK